MIDALGIKGIWKGADGKDDTRAVATLRTARDTATGVRRYLEDALIPRVVNPIFKVKPVVTVLSISDSIIIAAMPAANGPLVQWPLVDLVCQCAAYVQRMAAKEDPPLTYRGAINFGRMLIEDTFLLGPAVDEVAVQAECAAGAFIRLLPAAHALPPTKYHPDVWSTMAYAYDVPLKDGTTVATTALSPYVDTVERVERKKIRDGYEQAMNSQRPDVVLKRQNSLKFLDHVDKVQGITRLP